MFIISSHDHELVAKASKQVDEKISMKFLQNNSKHEISRLKAGVGS